MSSHKFVNSRQVEMNKTIITACRSFDWNASSGTIAPAVAIIATVTENQRPTRIMRVEYTFIRPATCSSAVAIYMLVENAVGQMRNVAKFEEGVSLNTLSAF